jgi:hypothetical protein
MSPSSPDPRRWNSQILIPPLLLEPCTHLFSLCPPGTQVQAPFLQVSLARHPLVKPSVAPAAPQVMGLGWGHQPREQQGQCESEGFQADPSTPTPQKQLGGYTPLSPSSPQFCCSSLVSPPGFQHHPSQEVSLCHLLSHMELE